MSDTKKASDSTAMAENRAITQPLLNDHVRVSKLSSEGMEEFLEHDPAPMKWWPWLVFWESKLLWYLSGASITSSIFNFMLGLVTQMFAGHVSSLDLAGASIGLGIQGLGCGFLLGMATATQTVCGLAYGAKNYAFMGVVCQKAIILQLGVSIPLSFVFWYSSTILRAIGQSDSIAEQGQIFTRASIAQVFAYAIYCPMQRFLQAQNIVNPLAYTSFGIFMVHVLLTWLAVDVAKFGLVGAAFALNLSYWLLVLVTGLYIIFSPSCKKTWTGLSSKALHGIWSYLKLTLASTVMVCLGIWYNQGVVLISGLLPNPAISLTSISICMNYLNWSIQFIFGLGTGASVRIGNELGAGNPMVARLSVIVVTATGVFISIVFSALVLIFRTTLSRVFTSDDTIIAAVSDLAPLLAIVVFLAGIQPIFVGVAIGSGWQGLVAYINLIAYYIIGLPIGCVLGFKAGLGMAGIWCGMAFAAFFQTVTLSTFIARTNWNEEVERAAKCIKLSADDEKQGLVSNIA